VRVTVQLYARLRELAGGQDWVYDLAPGASVADVWRAVAAAHPPLATLAPSVSAALNEQFTAMTAEVHDGDAVAFLPPVSGGAERDV
jgi:molybdopterin converting factor small subunit